MVEETSRKGDVLKVVFESYSNKKETWMSRKLFLLFTTLIMLGLSACAVPAPKEETAAEEVCKNLVLFNQSLDQLNNASQFADEAAVQAQFDVVRRNFNALSASVVNLDTAEKDDFENAVADMMEVAASVPEGTSVTDTLTVLKDPIDQVRAAANNLKTGLECK
jgi:hypothetical protein